MDFLKSSKRRSLLSESVYIGLNVAFAAALLAIVLAIESPFLAFALVLLSKWRVFAVRPRYWYVNVQANLVDVIVSLSLVILLYAASGALAMQILLTLLYVGWLLFIKPRSKRAFVAVQSGIAIFLGVTAVMTVSYDWIASIVVVLMWLIGYSAARHVLNSYDEVHGAFYSLVWGLVFAELGWLAYHWTFAYSLPGMSALQLSQVALAALGVSFVAERMYTSYIAHSKIRAVDVLLPTLLVSSLILILLLFFNSPGNGTF
ncbi:MAG: hypothetical protein ABIR91_04820 [Candidatus Saccharimonadales bacterium]